MECTADKSKQAIDLQLLIPRSLDASNALFVSISRLKPSLMGYHRKKITTNAIHIAVNARCTQNDMNSFSVRL
jgi:hypothetical protein